jgi:hypothetical protein
LSIKKVTYGTGDIVAYGDIKLGGRLTNPNGTVGLMIGPSGQAYLSGAILINGALTGATTGAFSSTITNTVAGLVMGTAAGTTGGLIETNTTAAAAVAPIQISPSVEWRGTAWDSASKTHNWRTYANVMYDATTSTSRLATQYGYNGVTQALQTDRVSIGSEGTLDVFGASFGSETLTNGALTSGTSWTRTGDMALASNAATYTHSTAVGTLTQAQATLATAAAANRWYAFTYTTSSVTTGATAYIGTEFAQKRIYLNLVAGTYVVYFKAAAAPTDFKIYVTSTAGAFTIDTLSLLEVQSGDVIANGLFTGGGAGGLKIDGSGNAVFSAKVRLKGYTVSTLPTGVTGDMAYVTDALAPTFGATVAGSGAVIMKVFYNGTNWIVG